MMQAMQEVDNEMKQPRCALDKLPEATEIAFTHEQAKAKFGGSGGGAGACPFMSSSKVNILN